LGCGLIPSAAAPTTTATTESTTAAVDHSIHIDEIRFDGQLAALCTVTVDGHPDQNGLVDVAGAYIVMPTIVFPGWWIPISPSVISILAKCCGNAGQATKCNHPVHWW
jgi:hypothetical protein